MGFWANKVITYSCSSTEKEWLPVEKEHPPLYKENLATPFYHGGNIPDKTIEDCIDILTKDNNEEYVCHRQIMHVQLNAVFLINTVSVKRQDLPADDNGTYRNTGTRVWTYEVARKPTGKVKK